MDSIAPKSTPAGSNAGSRRAAGAAGSGGANDGNRVNLGEQTQKRQGGCCQGYFGYFPLRLSSRLALPGFVILGFAPRLRD
jgi:hypothetical protein